MHTPWRPEQRLNNAQALGESSLMFLVHPTLSEQSMQKTVTTIRDGHGRNLKRNGRIICAIQFSDFYRFRALSERHHPIY